jgi:hypothetical protein
MLVPLVWLLFELPVEKQIKKETRPKGLKFALACSLVGTFYCSYYVWNDSPKLVLSVALKGHKTIMVLIKIISISFTRWGKLVNYLSIEYAFFKDKLDTALSKRCLRLLSLNVQIKKKSDVIDFGCWSRTKIIFSHNLILQFSTGVQDKLSSFINHFR